MTNIYAPYPVNPVSPSIQTTDASRILTVKPAKPKIRASHPMIYRRPTQDTVISTVTPEEDAAWAKRMATMSGFDGGTMWQGDLQPVGEAVARVTDALRRVKDKARQRDALSQAVCALADYGNHLSNSEGDLGPADALSFEGNDELTREDVHAANNISKAATGDSGGAQMRAWRDQTGNQIAKMQRQFDAYWEKQTAWHK